MKPFINAALFCLLLGVVSCKTLKVPVIEPTTSKDDGKLELVFIQINDVYEIAPLEGGKSGGMARVATLKKQYQQSNKNTLMVIAGDFVSPSVFNSLQFNGKRIRGTQMIEAMNAAGIDLAIFGNHEFDINDNELQERINESNFQWVASNAFHLKQGKVVPFEKVRNNDTIKFPQSLIMTFTDDDSTSVRIGFIGLTLPFNKAPFVSYTDALTSAKELYTSLKDSCDAVVAITHQTIDQDVELAKQIPGLALILGGHEHDMRFKKVGHINITKAHANAKSAYVVKLLVDKKSKSHHATPQLKMLDETVALDSMTSIVVKKWMDIGEQNYTSLGFDAKKIIINKGDTLDGREAYVRRRSTNLTSIVTASMAEACPEADLVIFNAGSIRVDDLLPPPISEYDIIRSLPFGGAIRVADMKGRLLLQVLEAGRKNITTGGFLHYQPLKYIVSVNSYTLNGHPIVAEKVYKVAITDFLILGLEANLGFLNKDNPDIVKIYPEDSAANSSKSDIRLAVVRYLKKISIKNQ